MCLDDEVFVVCSHDHDDAACLHLLNGLRKNGVSAQKRQMLWLISYVFHSFSLLGFRSSFA